MIKIIIVEPNKQLYIKEVENKLSVLQNIVGGYIETVFIGNDIILICNEEGKLMGLPYNKTVYNEPIVGTFFLTSSNSEGNFISLTDEQIELCMDLLSYL